MNPSLGVSAGIRAFFGGIGFIIGTPGVWPFAAVPVLVLLLISIGLTVLGIYGAGWLTEWIFGAEELSTWSKIGAWPSPASAAPIRQGLPECSAGCGSPCSR
jgi:hypothetical protein